MLLDVRLKNIYIPVYLAINSHILQTSHEAHIVLLANLHSSKMPQIFFSVISNMSRSEVESNELHLLALL